MFSLVTGSGAWNPLVWIVAALICTVIIYWFRERGESSYKPETEQTKPFLSGEGTDRGEDILVRSSNVYWGLTKALRSYFQPLARFHTGVINDYMGWLMVVLAVGFIVISVT